MELNTGPHQIVLICRYDSLTKLSMMDEKHLSGLGIPDLPMDYVCHVAVNLSWLSVPDCNMDYVCHVPMRMSGLSEPDCNMDYVCHVQMRLSGLSVTDCNMDYVCHVTMKLLSLSVPDCIIDYYMCHVASDVSGLSIIDVSMEYVCHKHKIKMEIESVPTCQERCCKHDIKLAYMFSLVLLLGGDVELNPGPRHNVIDDASEKTRECDSERQSTSSVHSRLVMLICRANFSTGKVDRQPKTKA